MFSFKNGILNINLNRSGFDIAVDMSFLLLLCSIFINGSSFEGENYFYYIAFFTFLGTTMVKLMMRFKSEETIILPQFTIWYGSFVVLSLLSMLWALYPENSTLVMSRLIQSLVITFCMAQNYATRPGLMKCIQLFAWAGAYATAVVFIRTPVAEWFMGGFGYSASKYNANTVGMIFTLCVLVSFYLAFYCKARYYYILAFFQFFAVILTSSRKSLIASMIGIMLLIVMRSKKKTLIWRVLIAAGLFAVVWFIVMTVPNLYNAIGVRFDSMFAHITNDGGDYSMTLRRSFIENAQDMFFEKPILGYGINNFSKQMFFRTGISDYAHNNYYEILANLGIVGLAVFYGYYFYLMFSMLKIWRHSNGSLLKLMLVLLAVIMICEYGMVTYYALYIHVVLNMIYLFICAYNNPDRSYRTGAGKLNYKQGIYE